MASPKGLLMLLAAAADMRCCNHAIVEQTPSYTRTGGVLHATCSQGTVLLDLQCDT